MSQLAQILNDLESCVRKHSWMRTDRKPGVRKEIDWLRQQAHDREKILTEALRAIAKKDIMSPSVMTDIARKALEQTQTEKPDGR